MIKRDYVLRLIEQLAQTVHRALGYLRAGDHDTALQVLDDAMAEWFGWDSTFVNSMPEPYLLGLLAPGGRLERDKAALLATLLKAEGDVLMARGDEGKAQHRHGRALHLFLSVHETPGPPLPAELDGIEGVREALAPYVLPLATRHRLWHYLASRGALAEAEDLLWQLLEHPDAPPALPAEARAFYERLLQQPEPVLVAGGLSRHEVEAALEEL